MLQFCAMHDIKVINHDIRSPNYTSLAGYRAQHPDITSFALVRNPWDRVVSSYHYLKDGGMSAWDRVDAARFVNPYDSFRTFVLEAFENGEILKQIHFRPQNEWLSDENGLIVDQIGKFETLQSSFSKWFELLGLPDYELPHINKSTHKPYREYYSDDTRQVIGEIYKKDVDLFEYSF